jgi:hypothetical protein
MTRLTRVCRALGVGLAALTATLAMTQAANAAPPPPPDFPANLVPDGASQFLSAHAKGVQIYKCTKTGETFAWIFQGPRADLVGDNGQVIKHAIGPTWTAVADSSSVIKNGAAKNAASPDPGNNIDWLLVPVGANTSNPATSNDPGDLLTGTTFVQRIHTQGGTPPPAAECRAQTVDQVREVPYQADYVFFKATAPTGGA